MQIIEPQIGCWYKNALDGGEFEVVAMEDNDYAIEIQYFDGEIEEIDRETWYQLRLMHIAPPEDCSGAYALDSEDVYHRSIEIQPENWQVLNDIECEINDDLETE